MDSIVSGSNTDTMVREKNMSQMCVVVRNPRTTRSFEIGGDGVGPRPSFEVDALGVPSALLTHVLPARFHQQLFVCLLQFDSDNIFTRLNTHCLTEKWIVLTVSVQGCSPSNALAQSLACVAHLFAVVSFCSNVFSRFCFLGDPCPFKHGSEDNTC